MDVGRGKKNPQKGNAPKSRSKARKYVSVKREDQPEEMRAQSTDQQDTKTCLEEEAGRTAAREGRGYPGLVQGR